MGVAVTPSLLATSPPSPTPISTSTNSIRFCPLPWVLASSSKYGLMASHGGHVLLVNIAATALFCCNTERKLAAEVQIWRLEARDCRLGP